MYNTEEKKYNQTNKLTGATTTPVFDILSLDKISQI